MRGRKPKPRMLRLVGGNAGRRPLNEAEPAPEAGIPDPPSALCKKGLAEWRRVAEPLYHAGILTKLDRAVLAAYCDSYARWREAAQVLTRMAAADPVTGGLVIRTSNGNVIQNPILGIANKARAETVRYAVELGMTPSARTRVKANKAIDPSDPARKYF